MSLRTANPRHRNDNREHRESLSLQQRIGLSITNVVGTMWCAYAFAVLALVSLPAAIRSHDPVILVSWLSQTFLQLVLLSIIIVGQNVQALHSERRAEADFEVNQQAEREVQTILERLQTLNEATERNTEMILKLMGQQAGA
jgi:uncharacterized membrane protein